MHVKRELLDKGCFCHDERAVHCLQPVFSCRVALAASKAVAVTYESLGRPVLDIDDAIELSSYLNYSSKIIDGDVEAAMAAEGVKVRF